MMVSVAPATETLSDALSPPNAEGIFFARASILPSAVESISESALLSPSNSGGGAWAIDR
ncbi:protein of unknown function (plasmid) [Cupriavidus taiwanensis]|nr:hypothetical protein CBM2598_U30133 [Cupriavidus taiwanensis]SPD38119.1 protein of unknown function [Cupriavidus taiwanensis]